MNELSDNGSLTMLILEGGVFLVIVAFLVYAFMLLCGSIITMWGEIKDKLDLRRN